MALFVASDSDSGTLEYSYSSTEVQSDEDGFQKNPFLMFRKAYGPPPPPDPTDLPWPDKNEQPHAGHKSVPSHEHIVQDDMEEDENLSSYDADDSASGTFETLSTDRESRMHLDNVSELRGSYGYTTEDSELGDNPGARPSSRAGSIYSFHSSVDSHLFRDFHGRKFNTLNPVYHLPADMEEHERLSIQHRILCLFFGNLYPAGDVVESILKAREGYTPMILDVGAGGTMEMALKFPHCEVVGLDIVPPNLGNREIPPNCRFEVDDANLSLTHYANMFDLVHCRAVEMAIQDWEAFSYNIAQTLKPGGMFLSSTGNTQFLNERGEPLRVVTEGRVGFRWIQKVFSAIHEAIE
ncbi:hypothetical protein FRC03_009373 [Tulasnella sp. 419]|nr:hypothetical protein FRC03_009373 [Tulasnella sp. 419]